MPASGAVASDMPILAGGTAASANTVEGIINVLRTSICNRVETIKVDLLPDYFEGPVPFKPDAQVLALLLKPSRIEAWSVTGCGRKTVAMLVLSYDSSGTEHYHIGTPQGWYHGP
jgi:hypothetical protein